MATKVTAGTVGSQVFYTLLLLYGAFLLVFFVRSKLASYNRTMGYTGVDNSGVPPITGLPR